METPLLCSSIKNKKSLSQGLVMVPKTNKAIFVPNLYQHLTRKVEHHSLKLKGALLYFLYLQYSEDNDTNSQICILSATE